MAEGKVWEFVRIDTSVGKDNLGKMTIKGNSVYFHLSPAEVAGKVAFLMPYRWMTGNTVQRCGSVAIYNCDKHTKKQLKSSFILNNDYTNLDRIQDVLKECKKSFSKSPRRRENVCFGGEEFEDLNYMKPGLVGFEIWLADD